MSKSKKWNVLSKVKTQNSKLKSEELIDILLENRGLVTKEEKETFLHPKLEDVTVDSVGIDKKNLQEALQRIQKANDEKEQIVIFGDYDVDGITATAILWETLYALGAQVAPYIPGRIEEGYGLSIQGIENLKSQISNLKNKTQNSKPSLIITVDNGIVAHEAVQFANQQGIDVIITDHHTRAEKDPEAYAIVHTTKLCGAGVAYLLAQEIQDSSFAKAAGDKQKSKIKKNSSSSDPALAGESRSMGDISSRQARTISSNHLELVCLATIADLVPLTGANRTLVKFGLKSLRKTQRIGLLELFDEAGVEQAKIGVYEIGHIIAPRLNAMGRMASAMDSLRLLCTKDISRAKNLAHLLGSTNRERQLLTQEMTQHAIGRFKIQDLRFKKVLFVADAMYEQGVIGLVASKLVETYYRPSIVLSVGEKITKASARSVSGFNIIEFIRSNAHLLVNAGGHPMAAGFTVETEKLSLLQETMERMAMDMVTDDLLVRTVKIDCELPLSFVSKKVYDALQPLQPFGMANQEPIFVSRRVVVDSIRAIGKERNHLKLALFQRHPELDSGSIPQKKKRDSSTSFHFAQNDKEAFGAVAFGFGEMIEKIRVGDVIDIAYTIDENTWNGNTTLQLKIKDIKLNEKN